MISICFVCLGNICRSPTAEGVMKHLLSKNGLDSEFHIESAGTISTHVGELADPRTRAAAKRRGISLTSRAQHFTPAHFDRFDHIVVMDASNFKNVQLMARTDSDREKITMFRSFDSASPKGAEVPDPYYGGEEGFEHVLDIAFAGCEGILRALTSRNRPLK